MNIKKLVVTAAAGAVMLSAVVPAFAESSNHGTSVSNRGNINNTSVNVANTGLNRGGNRGDVRTGNASAVQLTGNVISTTSSCGCGSSHGTTVSNNGDIHNTSVNVANTGLNSGGDVRTGNAFAGQGVVNVVNTSVN